GFERWLADERNRLERTRRRVAHQIIEEGRAEGDYQGMRAEAESLLELDALDEKAMLAFLEALQLAGDRTLALRRYTEFEKRLKEELDAEPGSALRGWARRNRKGDSEAGLRYVPIPRVSEITVLPSPQPIFGRVEEYALLWNAWEQTKTGKGAFIVLEGDAGIGKTALATKLANQVHVAGGSVCFVKCYRTEKSVPFAPATALIRQLSRLPGFVALDPVWIGELTRLVPELRERYRNAPQPMAVDDAARHRLSDAIVQAALAVADEQPLLVVVDDLQDADEATLAALHYLGRTAPEQPVLFVGIHRASEQLTELERAFLDGVAPEPRTRRVTLSALPTADVERLVLQVLARGGTQARGEVVELIVARSRGNPLQAIEAAVSATTSLTEVDPKPAKLSDPTFAATVGERLDQLSESALLVARAIAVAGRPLSGYELASITRLQIAEMAAAIRALEARQFIKRSDGSVGFSHERYTQAVEERIDDPTRRLLHHDLAQLLRQSAAKNPAARYEVAQHYAAAGHLKEAKSQALSAAQYAKSLGGVRERADALQLVMAVSPRFDPRTGLDLGGCLLNLRAFDELERLCEMAERQELDAEGSAGFRYLRIATALGTGRADYRETAADLGRLLQLQPTFEFESAARILLMRVAYRSGDFASSREAARSLRKRRTKHGAIDAGHVFIAGAYVAAKFFRPKRAQPLLRAALADAQARHDLDVEHWCRQGLGAVCRQLGRFKDAVCEHELALALARRTLNPVLVAEDTSDMAVAEMALGRVERSNELFEEASAVLEHQLDPHAPGFVRANQAELILGTNDFERARALFESALERALWLKDLPVTIQVLGGLALCAQRVGSVGDLAHWTSELRRIGGGREKLYHERWLAESAIAWDIALNHHEASAAVDQLQVAASRLRRCDIEHWLLVSLECLRLRTACDGTAPDAEIDSLRAAAASYEAGTVLRGLEDLLQTKGPSD
ncbi:MAG: AAA family ATPase, partial [Terriglobales bacterium]